MTSLVGDDGKMQAADFRETKFAEKLKDEGFDILPERHDGAKDVMGIVFDIETWDEENVVSVCVEQRDRLKSRLSEEKNMRVFEPCQVFLNKSKDEGRIVCLTEEIDNAEQ